LAGPTDLAALIFREMKSEYYGDEKLSRHFLDRSTIGVILLYEIVNPHTTFLELQESEDQFCGYALPFLWALIGNKMH